MCGVKSYYIPTRRRLPPRPVGSRATFVPAPVSVRTPVAPDSRKRPAALSRRRLEFWLLELDGKIVAAQFALRHGESVFALQEGFDPQYASDSVGYVLRAQVLKNLIDRGIRRYDFLGGDEDSKLRWGAQVKSYLDIEFSRPGSKGSVLLSLKYRSAGMKAWLRASLPDPILTTLKRLRGPHLKVRVGDCGRERASPGP